MDKVLITGGTGTIGKEVISELLDKKFDVYALTIDEQIDKENLHWIKVDLFNEKKLKDIFVKIQPKYLIHLAWPSIVNLDIATHEAFKDASMDLLKLFKENNGKKAVFAGSCFEYKFKPSAIKEDGELNPSTEYSKNKIKLLEEAIKYSENNAIDFAWGRVFYVFGQGEAGKRLTPTILDGLRNNKKIVIKTAQMEKDYIYTKDIAGAFVAIMQSNVKGVVNICSGKKVSVGNFAQEFASQVGKEWLLDLHEENADNYSNIVGDNSRLINEVGYQLKYDLTSAVADIIKQENIRKKISIVVPCYNEQDNVEDTYHILKNIFKTLPKYDFEIVFSDNDSKDKTSQILREIANKDKSVKVIINNRNFGFDCNIFNGVMSANGDAVIFLCCDRQDPPEKIKEFIECWEQGNKVVWGQKIGSKESRLMFFFRSVYYKLIKCFADVKQYSHVIGYGLYDRDVIEQMRKLKDPHPILRNIVPNLGYKPILLPYEQKKREKGKSSFRFFILVDYALNSLVHTSKFPMKCMIYIGIIGGFISFLVGLYGLLYKLFNWGIPVPGFAAIIVSVAFATSVILLSLGIIGEYLLSVLDRVSFTKYVVEKERINF